MGLALLVLGGCSHSTGVLVASEETVGGLGPLTRGHNDAASDGSWVVLHQFGLDDPPRPPLHPHVDSSYLPKLLVAGRPPLPIDGHIRSPNDRFVLVLRDDRYALHDVATGDETDVGAKIEDDALMQRLDPAAPIAPDPDTNIYGVKGLCYIEFSDDGRAFAHLEPGPRGRQLVVHDLENLHRHEIELGPGVVDRVQVMPDGEFVAVTMSVEGEAPPSDPPRSDLGRTPSGTYTGWTSGAEAFRSCRGPMRLHPEMSTVTRVLDLDGNEVGRQPGAYLRMGTKLVRPIREGGYWWWRPTDEERSRSSTCEGRILTLDRAAGRILALCDPEQAPAPRKRARQRGRLVIDTLGETIELGPYEFSDPPDRAEAWISYSVIDDRDGPVVVDLDTARVTRLPPRLEVLGIFNGRALARRDRNSIRRRSMKLELFDLASGEAVASFWIREHGWLSAIGNGSTVAVGRWVIDMDAGELWGRLPSDALAITDDGRLLARGGHAGAPLRWFSYVTEGRHGEPRSSR